MIVDIVIVVLIVSAIFVLVFSEESRIKRTREISAPVDLLYYAAFAIYSFFHLMETTNITHVLGLEMDYASKIATALALILLLPRFFSIRFSAESLVKAGIVLAIGLLVFFLTESWIPLCIGLFVCAGRGLNIRPIIVIMLLVAVMVFSLAYLGSRFGMVESILVRRPWETRVRDPLGFAQVNSVGLVAVRVCTAVVYLRWVDGRKAIPSALFCLGIAFLVEIIANSRTSEVYLLVLAATTLYFSQETDRKVNKHFEPHKFALLVVIISIIVSIAIVLFFTPSNVIWQQFDHILSGRPYTYWWFFNNYPPVLLGNDGLEITYEVMWTGYSTAVMTLDNAWVQWLITYGLLPTAIIAYGIICIISSSYNKKTIPPVMLMALTCALIGFCESSAFSIDMNPFLIVLACVLYGDDVETMMGRER